jgi:Fe-S-cluster-containing dehydrogenase component
MTVAKNGEGAPNALFINYKYCSGCHSCELACRQELGLSLEEFGIKLTQDGPRQFEDGTWEWNYIPVPSRKCDLCQDRVNQGLEPSCVQHCQAKCMGFGTIEECSEMLAEAGGYACVFVPPSMKK